ncbi:complement resistance protein TraT [Pseudodesulfovibrio sediminis]|uniref:Uncharacterized protein n=1 Tax=Pseudodesulfovibrio sediminis TaxID=2810563 RepID=A0ABM7P2N1_9BACT|nr:complement resistance protein TraT [Pseudodesulfovibrio sediminis]BCS87035.1 hypothetical protein PSDVSF_02770 [Pseudodesulfovibrio sediminis]
MFKKRQTLPIVLALVLVLTACVARQQNPHQLVEDEKTGYSYGAIKDGEFIADPAMFRNAKLKLRIRNTTGDSSLDIKIFRQQLEKSYGDLGYEITDGDDFGILLDVNVRYFGQVTEMLPAEYSFLGAAAGGVVGATPGIQSGRSADSLTGAAGGAVVGAALTEIMRNYATEETFIIISSITMGTVMPERVEDETTISFVTGKKVKEKKTNFKGFRSRDTVNLAVYAGGMMAAKSDIINEVRARHLRILRDII